MTDDPVPLGTLASLMRWLARELERDRSPLAGAAADIARLMKTGAGGGGCKSCGGPVEAVPRGRPRLHCRTCRPPRATKAAKSAR